MNSNNLLIVKVKLKICGGCGELRPIWATEDGVKYCKRCWTTRCAQQTKSVKKPTTNMKPHHSLTKKTTKKIANRSKKRSSEERQYAKNRRVFLREHPICCANIPGICSIQSTEVHHAKGRIGELLLDQTYWKPLCHSCHNWVDHNPEAATDLGLIINRLT